MSPIKLESKILKHENQGKMIKKEQSQPAHFTDSICTSLKSHWFTILDNVIEYSTNH